MKALFFDKKLELVDYPAPEKKRGEALVRVLMAGICKTDLEIIKGYQGFKGVLGHEFVGVVEASESQDLLGKRVVGEINIGCGDCHYCIKGLKNHCQKRGVLGILNNDGAFAEYLLLPEGNLHLVPDKIADEEAVFVEPLAAGFRIVQQTQVKPSDKVIVLGDGKLGLLIAQVLALTGCDLLVVGKHPSKLSLLKSRGIKTCLFEHSDEKKADVIVECTGSSKGIETALRQTRPGGTLVLKSTIAQNKGFDPTPLVIDEITLLGSRCGPFPPAIRALERELIAVKPLISGVYSLKEGIRAFKEASKREVVKILLNMNQ